MRHTFVIAAVGTVLLNLGCHSSTKPPPAEARESANPSQTTIRSNQEDVSTLAAAVRNAPDAVAEADALRRLHRYATDNAMTYDVKPVSTTTGQPAQSPAVAGELLRVTVTTYRGQQPVYSFTFVPKDNRNLSILSAQ